MPNTSGHHYARYFKRRRKRNSRLADKKINTLVEKRIKEIAQKEDNKNQVWVIDKKVLPNTWEDMGAAPAQISDYDVIPNNNEMYSMNLSNPGLLVQTPQANASGTATSKTCEIRVRAVQAFLRFVNTDNFTRTVRCALAYIPNLNINTVVADQPLQPQRWWLGDTNSKYRGMFAKEIHYRSSSATYPEDAGDSQPGVKVRILDQKVIKLPPPTVYDVKGATVDDIIQHNIRDVSLSHYFKGLGKKESFTYFSNISEDQAQMLTSGNYRLLIASDEPDGAVTPKVRFYGVAGCKMRVSGAPLNLQNKS